MTYIEVRQDILNRGFQITESQSLSLELGGIPQIFVLVRLDKMDSDGVNFNWAAKLPREMYLNEEANINTLKQGSRDLEVVISNRHMQNPNNCEHDIINHNHNKVCTKCMAKLGVTIPVNVNFN